MKTRKIVVKIDGMTCSSCEILIERLFKKIPGIESVNVDRSAGKAELHCSKEPRLEALMEAVKDHGYSVSLSDVKDPKGTNRYEIEIKRDHIEILGWLLLILVASAVFQKLNLLPQIGISHNMSYLLIFAMGILASLSTCAAVTGGILLAASSKYNQMHHNLTGAQRFRPHIFFNAGRIVSYTTFGALLGIVGSSITLSPWANGMLLIIGSLSMILLGLQLLKLFPALSRFHLGFPKRFSNKILDASNKPTAPFLLGASTFFLPCGFTQALQLYVLSRSDPVLGALAMFMFSIGTLPGTLSIGAISSFVKGDFQKHFFKFSGVLIVIVGIFSIGNGLALAGVNFGYPVLTSGSLQKATATAAPIINGKQIVEMTVNGLSYSPSKFTVFQGVPVEWHIDGRQAAGCAQVIIAPKLKIAEYLPRDTVKTVVFLPRETGTIGFGCSMGMTTPGAAFNVVPNDKDVVSDVNEESDDEQRGEVQILQMEVSRERGFYPNKFTVKKGIPVILDINAKVPVNGCMSTMVIPQYNVAHLITLGKTTVKFTPTKAGNVEFTCGMGIKMGEFRVVDA